MKSNGLTFHHPVVFWFGCAALVAGVLAHIPMFLMAANDGYRMAGMPMDATMLTGMFLIPAGLALAAYGMMPRLARLRSAAQGRSVSFHIADGARLNSEHWKLVIVLLVALAVDVMKPATLGFVLPGMSHEYGITKQSAAWLALVALTGTVVGSLVWGRVADVYGRRATILLSALMFMGTAICGAMPAFQWNLAMCFLMGASAGGLLPITFTLMAEMIPTRHRGWLLVMLGGVGTSAGYLLAAGSAAWLEPLFSWRSLWLLGLPTGAMIIVLDRFIPESPRFLVNAGLNREAREVLSKFSGEFDNDNAEHAHGVIEEQKGGFMQLLQGSHAIVTCGLLVCGLAWGLVNFGFVLWLPSNLTNMGMNAGAASGLLARSAFLAMPGIPLVTLLYHRWSSVKSLGLFIVLCTASLLAFFVLGRIGMLNTVTIVVATVSLLVSSSGVIAMMIPYAAEIYPVHLRATGAGVIAAGSKFGGILGAVAGVCGLFNDMNLSSLVIALPMALSAAILMKSGIDTRGRNLEEIQDAMTVRSVAE